MESLVRIQELEEKLQLIESQNQALQRKVSNRAKADAVLFQNLFLNISQACIIFKPIDGGKDFIIEDVNAAFERIEGFKKALVIGKKLSETYQYISSTVLEVFQRVYKNNKSEKVVLSWNGKDKKKQWRDNDIFKLSSGELVAVYADITDEKEKEEALLSSEARYKSLADASNEAVFFTVDAFCVDLNDRALEMFDYPREEAIGSHVLKIVDKAYHALVTKNIFNKVTGSYVIYVIHADGHKFPVRVKSRFFDFKGQETRITTMQDISFEKEKEKAILNSEARYKAIADAASEAVFIMENGKCIDLNEKATEIYGYAYEEAIGIPILDLIAPESKDLVQQKFIMEYAQPYEGMCIRKNGEIFYAELRGKNFEYADRKVRISTIRDISDQKQTEIKLSKSEAKFRSYFENHKAIKLQIDVETNKIADANKSALSFYGYTKEELLGKSIFELNALPKEQVLELMKKAASGAESSFSFPHRLKSGALRDVKVYTTLMDVNGQNYFFSIMHDVTEAKKIEDELQRSEARFRAYFENNTVAMLQVDPKSKQIIEANAAALRFYGYTCKQFKKLTAYDINILSPDEIDKKMQEVINSPTQTYIFNHRLASGEIREVEVYVSPIHTDAESKLFITIYDVTEREANKRALEENERKLIKAQSIAKIGSWEFTYNPEGAKWSNETYNIFDLDKSCILNKETNRKLIHPDDLESHLALIQQNVKDKKPHHSIHRIITASGRIKHVEEKGYAVYDKNDIPQKMIGTIQDITEQKLAEIELKKSKSYLKEAQRIAKVGHFDHNFSNKETNWSDEVSRIFGFNPEKTKPSFEKYRKQVHPDDVDNQYKRVERARKEKRGYTVSYRINSLSGEEKHIEEKGYFELDKNGVPIKIIGTMQDITSNYLVKKALGESKAQLAQINRNLEIRVKEELKKSRDKDHLLIQQSRSAVLGEMIGNIAHQWRQPLNEVSLLINDLEDAYSFGVLNKAYFEKTMEIVYRRLKYMSETINDFSKMHTDDFKKEVFSPKDLIEKLMHFNEGAMKKNKIQLRFMCNDDFEVEGYPNMLSHILHNLLNNSRDIIVERSIKRPKIWIKLEKNETNYSIRVLDNGKGVKRDVIDKIFDPYFTTKDKKRGSGLGLYMTKSMVEKQMHGQIQMQNQRDGAEFKITLDLKNDKE
jgi:PAS domain S-box-containing protein